MTHNWLTLVPAYGRDYTVAQAVFLDWVMRKDFKIADVSCKWNGSYIGIGEAESLHDTIFKIRFNKVADFVFIKKVGDEFKIIGTSSDEELINVEDDES